MGNAVARGVVSSMIDDMMLSATVYRSQVACAVASVMTPRMDHEWVRLAAT
jgi:hypothetical protein